MQRLFRMTAALIASLMVLFAAGPILAAAQAGVISDTSYESPLFGYEVEWTEDFAVVENFTTSGENSDQLRLLNETLGIWVDIWGFDTNRNAESMMPAYETLLTDAGIATDLEVTPVETILPDTGAAIYNYLAGSNATPLEEFTEFRTIDGAFIITSVKAAPDRSMIAGALVASMITIDGDPIFPAVFSEDDGGEDDPDEDDQTDPDEGDDDEPITTGQGLDGNVYSSPNYGVALSFDDDLWEVADEHEAEDEEDRDVLTLDLSEPPARLWLESYSTVVRASDCIESASDEALPDDADFELLEDADGEELEGTTRGVAWAGYAFVNEDGDEFATYVECRALPGGSGVFVATLLTNLADFDDAFAATVDILDTVNIDGGEPLEVEADDEETPEPDEDEEETPEPDEDEEETPEPDEDDQDGSGTLYTSETWGFTLEVDESVWEITRDRTRDEVDTLQLEADGDLFMEVSSFELGRRDDAQSCAEDFIADFDFDVSVDEEDGDEEIYSMLGTYEDDDGEEWVLVVTCRVDPEGDYVMRAVGEAPVDAEDDLLEAMALVVNSVEFP